MGEIVPQGQNYYDLPCGHRAYREDDRIITDQCFECGWMTPARRESHKLNDLAAERGNAEATLIRFVRHGEWKGLENEEDHIVELAKAVRTAWVAEETQREICKIVANKEESSQ